MTPKATHFGTVKFFNSEKGWGFVRVKGEPADASDVFVHYSAIQMEGYKTLSEGDEVEFEMEDGPKGRMAGSVRVVSSK